jgi:hypothetical protein
MITEPTLFILGAGASKPYGFPTGAELRAEIINEFRKELSRMLPSDSRSRQIEKERTVSHAEEFIDIFSHSPMNSIDKFLSLNPRFSVIGKMAIAISICRHEGESRFLEKMDVQDFKEDWYRLLFNIMTSSLKAPGDFARFRENKIAFITFNYDRSFEYFLYTSFCNTFSESRPEFDFKMEECIPFPIIHVYGQIGKLPIFYEKCEPYYRLWGNIDIEMIGKISKGVRVIGERAQEDIKEKVRGLLENYRRIFFLGFGYAEENLEAIGFPGSIDETWAINGTARGMTQKEIRDVRRSLGRNFNSRIYEAYPGVSPRIEDKNSYELLREHF